MIKYHTLGTQPSRRSILPFQVSMKNKVLKKVEGKGSLAVILILVAEEVDTCACIVACTF